MLNRDDFRQYQTRTIEFIREKKRCALFIDMGLGKTPCVLTALMDAISDLEVAKPIAVAPLRVAKNTWPKEVRKWAHLKGMTVSVIHGTLADRLNAVMRTADLYVINRENVAWLEKAKDAYGKLSRWKQSEPEQIYFDSQLGWLIDSIISGKELRQFLRHDKRLKTWTATPQDIEALRFHLRRFARLGRAATYDAWAVDESSSFKNKGTERWKSLRRQSRDASYVVLMTGTPRPNSMLEIHPQMQLLDGGERLGPSITRFKENHFRMADPYGRKWVLRSGHAEVIQEKIADICMTLKSEDYLQLPARIDEVVSLDLGPEHLAAYEVFEKEYILKLQSGDLVEAVSAGALAGKLMQYANGAMYDADKKVHYLHDEKIEALREIVEEANGAPILVAYNFKHDLARLKKAFPQAVVLDTDPETEDRWNRGEIPILLAHPKSAGHGLNLQDGGSIAVWFGLTWSLEEYLQFNKRLHRSGQRRDVYIKHLVAAGTIDELVLQVLRQRDADQEALLQALKWRVDQVMQAA